jgi:subtilisin-like proprotein convertase family protein
MSYLKLWVVLLGVSVVTLPAQVAKTTGQIAQTNVFSGINLTIPAGNPAGVTDVRAFTSGISQITSLQVQLKISGDYNGDLYCYLQHGSGLTVLLNRTGKTATSPYGYDDCGFDVTFSDSATNDIHEYRLLTTPPRGSPLTGIWQPDARFIDPTLVLDTTQRTTFLSEFDGLSPQGKWVLFLAGMEYGSTNTLNSWALQIAGIPKAVPSITWTKPAAITYGTPLSAAQLNATASIPGSFSYLPPAGTMLEAGTGQSLLVTFAPEDTNNYATATAIVSLDVLPRPLVVATANATRVYGAANPPLTGSVIGVTNGDNITVFCMTTANADSPVGSYTIVPFIQDPAGALNNYSVTATGGTLSITPAPLVVAAQNQSRPYGAANPFLTWTVSGLVAGDTQNSALTGSPILATAAAPASPVGAYPITLAPGSLQAANYTLSFVNGVLNVTQAALIGQVTTTSRLYGETNPPFNLSYSGFVNGDTASLVSGPLVWSCPAQTNSPAGTYPISVSGQSAPNYSIQYVPGTLTVAPAPLVVQANDATRAFGQTNPVFSATFLGLVNDEDASVLEGTLVFTTPAQTNSPVGTYSIEPSGLSSTNYTLTYSNGTLSVLPYALVVSAENQTRVYGAPNPPFTSTVTGLQNGDSITVNYSTSADTNSPVGTYDIEVVLVDPNSVLYDYSVTTNMGTLTITPAPLVVSADTQSRVYGAPNPLFTGAVAGLQNGDSITPVFWTTAQTNSPVGVYPIDIGLPDPDNVLGNYSVVTNTGVLTVTQAVLIGQANNASRFYGQTNPLFTVSYSGFVNGDNASVVTGPLSGSSPAQTNSPVGTYPISVWGQSALNYSIQYSPAILAVVPALLVVQANSTSRLVGQPNPVFTASFLGFVPDHDPTALGGLLAFTTAADTNSPVGSYPIVPSGITSTDYTVVYSNGTLRVCEYALVVAADDQTRTYGATNPPLTGTLTGLQNGDTITPIFSTAASTNSPVGTYGIEVAFDDPSNVLSNYSVTTNTGVLTITPAALVVNADNQTRAYGAPNPPLTGTVAGLLNGDPITATFFTAAGTNSPVGTYNVGVTLNDPEDLLSNYTVTTNMATLTITPAPLVVSADNQTRAYGAPNPPLTGAVTGLESGDNITPILSTAAAAGSAVGNYPITAGLSDPGGRLSNYSVTTNAGTLTVTPAPLVITPNNQSRSYGLPNPLLTGTVAGLQNGDNITATFSTTAGTGSPPGNYPITSILFDPGNLLPNYSVSTNAGVLTITPALLVVSAHNQTRAYGAPNPPLTGSFTGLQNGDNITAAYATIASAKSPPGTYLIAITLSDPDNLLPNYSVTTNAATLTVTPAVLVVSADSETRAYGVPNPLLTGTVAGLQNGDNITASFFTAAQTDSPPGAYPINIGLSDPNNLLPNYSVITNKGVLNINKAAATVTIVSSANPAPLSSPVTFTSTILFGTAPPGVEPPGSVVQFTLDGAPYGPPVALASGRASITIGALPIGSHSVTVEYQGNADFLGATAALTPPQMVGTNAAAANFVVNRSPGHGTKVSVADLVAASSDGMGGTLALASFSATTPHLGTVRLADGWLFYEPATGFGGADSFTYTVQDQYNISASATVTILVNSQAACTLTLLQTGSGTNRVLGSGLSWKTYIIEYEDRAGRSNWQWLALETAGAQGTFHYDDILPQGNTMRFYRAIGQADTTPNAVDVYVTSSANPALPGSPITLTALVSADDPGLGEPSGTVQFDIDGQPAGPPVALAQGFATFTTNSIPAGMHTIAAQYGGDDTFLTATGALATPQIINTPPIAGADLLYRPPTSGTKAPVSELLTNDFDPDGNPISFDNISPTSAEGGTVTLSDGWVFYTPPADFAGPDSFTYTIEDSFGATAVGTVTVEPLLSYGAEQSASFVELSNGTYSVTFTGIPWNIYVIQYTLDPTSGVWQTLGTAAANSWGAIQYVDTPPPGSPPRYYQAVAQSQTTIDSPFRIAAWTNFIANTNGRTMKMWAEYSLPEGWPAVPPVMAWETNCLLYGVEGFTAISQCNEYQGAPGQVPATLLTPRHAYTRGHGLGPNGLGNGLNGMHVWFCTASNTLVEMTIAANFIRLGTFGGEVYDYGILFFTEDVPPSITPMFVISQSDYQTYYPDTPDLPFLFFGTTAAGYCSADVPPFFFSLMNPGDSGSPNMIPTPDNKLAMFSGASTSAASPQMQADMDYLTTLAGLNTNNYQLHWYDIRAWGP